MAFKPDDTICFCFHVPLRKIEAYCRIEKPAAASQISDCLSAGTGCGWCRPMLKQIHLRICGEKLPWWWQTGDPAATGHAEAQGPALADDQAQKSRSGQDPANYALGRRAYIAAGQGKPPPEINAEVEPDNAKPSQS